MANYNYVAPIQYKSYSDMNKERIAAKTAANAASGINRQQAAIDKRKQQFIDNITGYKTAGWADAHRNEYNSHVQEAINEAYTNPTPDYNSMADAILRMQQIGDTHSQLRDGQTEYNSYMGENAPNYDADLDWGMEAVHDSTGYDERLNTFNNLGLINYSNGIGDFPNPKYKPSAEPGTPESMRTMKEVLNAQGIAIQMGPGGKEFYIDPNTGQQQLVSGSSFDVATEQFAGLWNPTLNAIEDKTAEQSFFSYTDSSGKPIFENHAKTLNRRVQAREEGYSYDEARAMLKGDVLNYLTPESPQADRSLMASAITAYEESTGQSWNNVQGNQALLATHGTPWDFFAEEIVNTADLYDPDKPTSGRNQNELDRKRMAFGSKPVIEPDRQFVREFGAEDFDWEEALRLSEESEDDVLKDLFKTVDVLDPVTNAPTGKTERVLKDMGEGVRVNMGQQDVKFDAVPIDNVEVFPDKNFAIVYATGYTSGKVGVDAGKPGDVWRYNELFGGKEGVAPFTIIKVLKDDGSFTEDYERLSNQFVRTYGYPNALQKKIQEAELARQ